MSNYTMSPVVNGEKKQMIVKVGDTSPIGGIIGYDTTQTIPDGWEYYAENQIKKIAPVTPANGNIENSYGTSQTDTYSQEYINNLNTYSTDEIRIGTWIDGKPLYRKVFSMQMPQVSTDGTFVTSQELITSLNADTIFFEKAFFIGNPYGEISINSLPTSNPNNLSQGAFIDIYGQNLEIKSNRTVWNSFTAYIILNYTKTTD